jgi:hypothetical protein
MFAVMKTFVTVISASTGRNDFILMMYQIVCGHVNYALGKTRMPVKKPKTLYFGYLHSLSIYI